jgi:hypothetical protein
MNDTPPITAKYDMNVVQFQPRRVSAFSGKRVPAVSADNIYKLLSLARYEGRGDRGFQNETPEDFGRRMRANIAAFIFVVLLAGLAAVDVIKLEQRQIVSPAAAIPLSPMISTNSSDF